MTQDAAQLGLEARASQDVYGSGPQSFPYVAFFQEPWYGGGDGGEVSAVSRRHAFRNLGFDPSVEHGSVMIHGGTVYCGTKAVTVTGGGEFGNGSDVYLNVTVEADGSFSAGLASSTSGDLSILLYRIRDKVLDDYVSGQMLVPYYN